MRAVRHRARIGVDVLPQQRDLPHALRGELPHLFQHRFERAAHFIAARVGHDAEAAVLAAAFHDRDERRRSLRRAAPAGDRTSRSRGSSTSTTGRPVRRSSAIISGRRCRVCGPNTRSTNGARCGDGLAFLAGDAAADTDDHVRALGLEPAPLAQQREHLLLRLLAHRAGVHQQHVRLRRVVGGREPAASVRARPPSGRSRTRSSGSRRF